MTDLKDPASLRRPEPLLVHATLVSGQEAEDAIDPAAIVRLLVAYGVLLFLSAAITGALAFGASYLAPRVYRADVLVEPVTPGENSGGLANLGASLGGVAGLLGVDISGAGQSTAASLAVLKSRQLLVQFIQRNDLLPVLYANRWDSERKQWKVDAKEIPTIDDAFERFSKKILSTREEKKGGLIVVSIDWYDRQQAATWANAIVAEANSYIAKQATAEANRNIEYLNAELLKADEVGLRQAIYSVVETEIKKRMLARTRADFAFRVLDPAAPPQAKLYIRPQRVLYAISGVLIGLFAAFVYAFLREKRSSATQPHE